ncbi:hypothetical protein O7606_16000 [Micromonospora sp. WMMD882]|uniref:vWA domain-containing protein n=1 Tax=Micromonospora sp. WMMD882 TaxID=3015151 RepID=UPI00248CA26D|nr:hypothetical protein [Micromonospora sp. WMMD882]WBB77773.1 hypothetical protein O7606_16000 [Micromonospora sp. WMMD882]
MTGPVFPSVQGPSSRLLITLVVDTSESMTDGDAIGQLNRALRRWRDDLRRESRLCRIGEIALVSFGVGGVTVVDPSGRSQGPVAEPFVPVDDFDPPTLPAGGFSPLVAGVRRALAVTAARRDRLAAAGVTMAYRPLVYLLTDGAPSDDRGGDDGSWPALAEELRRQEAANALLFFAFGVRGADERVLNALAPGAYQPIEGSDFPLLLKRVLHSIERVMSRRDQPASDVYADVSRAAAEDERTRRWFEEQGRR